MLNRFLKEVFWLLYCVTQIALIYPTVIYWTSQHRNIFVYLVICFLKNGIQCSALFLFGYICYMYFFLPSWHSYKFTDWLLPWVCTDMAVSAPEMHRWKEQVRLKKSYWFFNTVSNYGVQFCLFPIIKEILKKQKKGEQRVTRVVSYAGPCNTEKRIRELGFFSLEERRQGRYIVLPHKGKF